MSGRRRAKPGGEDDSGRWMATYGDVVTLLLAFFVLLYAISQVDQQKFQMFVSGLEVPFGNISAAEGLLSGSQGLASEGQGALPGNPHLQAVDGLGLIDGGTDVINVQDEPPAEPVTTVTTRPLPDENVLRTAEDLQRLRDQVAADLDAAGLANFAGFDLDARGLVIAVATDNVLFPSGSTTISVEGIEIIEVIAPNLSGFVNRILIEGHTDDVPLTKPGYDNWNLSTDRAVAVLRLLMDSYGIAPGRLAATGYGEHRPKGPNDDAEGRSANRRVELVIIAETEA